MKTLLFDLTSKRQPYAPLALLLLLITVVSVELIIGTGVLMLPPLLITGLVVAPFLLLMFLRKPEWSYFAFVFLLPFWDISFYQVGWLDVRPADIAIIIMVLTYIVNLFLGDQFHFQATVLGLPVLLFALWAAASAFWGSFSAASAAVVHFTYGLTIYFMTVNIIRDQKALRAATTVWILGGIIAAVIALYQFCIAPTETFARFGQIRSGAFFIGQNRLANYLIMCILLSFWRTLIAEGSYRRLTLIAASGVMLTGLLTTLNRTTVVGLVVGSVFFAYHSRRLRKPLFLSLLILLVVVLAVTKGRLVEVYMERFSLLLSGFSEASPKRIAGWRDAYEMFLTNPIMGVGFGNYIEIIREAGLESSVRVHNVYLGVLSELGLIGFFLFIGVLATIFFFVRETLALVKKDYYSFQMSLVATSGLIAYWFCTLTQAIYVQERGMWSCIGLTMAMLIISRNEVTAKA